MSALINITGHRFGRLVVIERAKQSGKHTMWLCRCDCGRETIVQYYNLKVGHTRSCGCLSLELSKARPYKHGHASNGKLSPTYRCWAGIIKRCTNPNTRFWKNYGGRGIKVCDRWRNSFEAFLADMGEGPAGLSIDRINNDGNYEPSNCRWTTRSERAKNRRKEAYIRPRGPDGKFISF